MFHIRVTYNDSSAHTPKPEKAVLFSIRKVTTYPASYYFLSNQPKNFISHVSSESSGYYLWHKLSRERIEN